MTFTARKPTGLFYWQYTFPENEKNLITSRIIRLEGLEKNLNQGVGVDTYDRYVYIHGTNHEESLGHPSSSGCVQLSNQDIVDLSSILPLHTHLYISRN